MKKLPMVFCANNVDTPLGMISEFPDRLGTLLTPGHWKDPTGIPYVLDNGRYAVWNSGKTWNEKLFFSFLDEAKKMSYPPLWLAVPDVVTNGPATLIEWNKWSPILRNAYDFKLALVVQQGITVEQIKRLKHQPDIIFVGGGNREWQWETLPTWIENFLCVHVGGITTEAGLWKVHRAGAESSDSNIWRPIGDHLKRLRRYLIESENELVGPTKKSNLFSAAKAEFPDMKAKCKDQKITKRYGLYWGDSCEVLQALPDDSVGFSCHSPPFSDLFSYSDSSEDIGNCKTYDEFFTHYGFLVEQLFRVTKPGRNAAVHCMDLPTFKRNGDEMGLRDFGGDIIKLFQKHGFIFHSRHCIWKDPLEAAFRTKALGLSHKQIVKDSVKTRTGIPDYILCFHKPGENLEPIEHPNGLTEYYGSRPVPSDLDKYIDYEGEQKTNKRSHWIWQQFASPVWFDLRHTKVLRFKPSKEKDDQRHICIGKGSLVLTEEGYKKIEDIEIGDLVLTHLGRWKPVTKKVCNGVRPVVKVIGHGIPGLLMTPDHRLWTRSCTGPDGGIFHHRKAARKNNPEWIPAIDVKCSYVNLKLPPIKESEYSVDDWWVVGRWLGDGSFGSRNHQSWISCATSEIEELAIGMKDRAGYISTNKSTSQIYVKDKDGWLRKLLKKCGRGSDKKHLPPEAFSLGVEKSEALLSGYLSADGHLVPGTGRWMASSVSYSLLLGIAMVAQRARGVVPSVFAGRAPGKCTIEGRICKTMQDWVFGMSDTNSSAMVLDDGAWKKVKKVEPAGKTEVWDIQVADDASFTAEGCIVHNCPFSLDCVYRCLTLWSNPGDIVLDPFSGVGSTVYCSVKLGRRGLGIELKKSYFRQSLANLQALDNKQESVL